MRAHRALVRDSRVVGMAFRRSRRIMCDGPRSGLVVCKRDHRVRCIPRYSEHKALQHDSDACNTISRQKERNFRCCFCVSSGILNFQPLAAATAFANRCLPPLRHPEPWSVGDGPGGPSVPYLGTKTGHIYSSSFSTNGERPPQGVHLWTVGAHLFSRGSDGQRWPVMASDALDDG